MSKAQERLERNPHAIEAIRRGDAALKRGEVVSVSIPGPPVRIVVTKSRKGYQWAQIARNGSAGAISPKTYDTKSNAVRAARRQAALVGGVVEVQ